MHPELSVTCPACQAPAGGPCTHPTDTGRRNVIWYHLARKDAARELSSTHD